MREFAGWISFVFQRMRPYHQVSLCSDNPFHLVTGVPLDDLGSCRCRFKPELSCTCNLGREILWEAITKERGGRRTGLAPLHTDRIAAVENGFSPRQSAEFIFRDRFRFGEGDTRQTAQRTFRRSAKAAQEKARLLAHK